MSFILDNKYELGEIVYLITDPDKFGRMVTGIKACLDQSLVYELTLGTIVTFHYEQEIEKENKYITDR